MSSTLIPFIMNQTTSSTTNAFILSNATSTTNVVNPHSMAYWSNQYDDAKDYELIRLRQHIRDLENQLCARRNKYLNASDLLEEFMGWVGEDPLLTKRDFAQLPVHLFIQWLIVRAAENDNEPIQEEKLALERAKRPVHRCGHCGRYTALGMPYCDSAHAIAARHRQRSRTALPVAGTGQHSLTAHGPASGAVP